MLRIISAPASWLSLDRFEEALSLATDPMTLLCSPESSLTRRKRVDWRTLGQESFVDFTIDWGSRQVTDRAFAVAGVARHIASEVHDVHTLLDLVGHGLAVAVVPPELRSGVASRSASSGGGPRTVEAGKGRTRM